MHEMTIVKASARPSTAIFATPGKAAGLSLTRSLTPHTAAIGAERAAKCSKHGGFGDPLRHQSRAGCAECPANGGFLFSRYGAHEQEIRDVDAGDQQHGRDGAQQDQGDGAKLAQQLFVKGNHFHAVARVFAVRSGIGMLGFIDMLRGNAQGGLRGFERDAGLEAGDHSRGVAPTEARIERHGNPDVDGSGPQAEFEIGRHHADHAPAGLAEANRLPDDGWIAAEAPHEKGMAEHDDAFRAGAIFLRRKRPSEYGHRSEHGEHFLADIHYGHPLGAAIAGQNVVKPENSAG